MTPPEIPTEPDAVPGRMIAGLLAVTVIAVLAAAVVVWLLADRRLGGGGERGAEARLPAEIEAVTTEPFGRPLTAEHDVDEKARSLERGAWLDAAHTRVRLPYTVARDRYLAALRGGDR